jgi:hypothetical protein
MEMPVGFMNMCSQRTSAAQSFTGIAVPQPSFVPLQAVLQRSCFDRVVVSQAPGVLPEPCQPYGDVEPVKMMLAAGRQVTHERADAVTAIGQHRDRLIR